jgi:hypothetical protein
VEMECGLRIRMAQNYMTITRLSAKYAFVASLPISVVLRLARARGRSEFLKKISASIGPGVRLKENEIYELLRKFTTMRRLQPRRRRISRPGQLKPVEKPSSKHPGYTKTEYARLNAQFMTEKWDLLGLLFFRTMMWSETVNETLPFVEAAIRRIEFERGLADLRLAVNQE